AESEEKREPVSDIDTGVVVSLKVLDPDGRLEKRTNAPQQRGYRRGPVSCVPPLEIALRGLRSDHQSTQGPSAIPNFLVRRRPAASLFGVLCRTRPTLRRLRHVLGAPEQIWNS